AANAASRDPVRLSVFGRDRFRLCGGTRSRKLAPFAPVSSEATAGLLYTSGTTGIPKGALLTHAAMLANARGTAQQLRVTPTDRWPSIIPLFHCAGCTMTLLGSLQAGAAYVGVPAFDPVDMFEVVQRERCTLLTGVPTTYLAMLDHPSRPQYDLSSLRA